ncbi:UDP-glucose 4-epimerase GalE [Phenylobacterium immobile]|uniref:UDP-glucose 4-epimerase GalE n=1 Tax=Phenylobacterium immobile TaxID=21 RepID=UPI000AC31AD5|nr:UDP-glucose 4-epimerase GalE [Phenylobacterium immobile]
MALSGDSGGADTAMQTVLVIGGAGYVGSHCCKQFALAGWRVVTFDNLSTGWRDLVKWGDFIEGDILDLPTLKAAIRATTPDVVAHFVGLTDVAGSMADPASYYRTNVVGSMNVADAMRAGGRDKIVFSSTAATYGAPQVELLTEEHRQEPISPYGSTKLIAERMLLHYETAYGLRSVALRYFNAAGADRDGDTGERHHPETHLIPLAARGLLRDDYVFTIFGEDFDTRDGTAVRDYVHVSDLARAHVAAADYLVAGGISQAINLGSGTGSTVMEIANAIEAVAGRRLQRRIGPRRAGDPAVLVASNQKAKRLLGWSPRPLGLSEIIRTAWRWHSVTDHGWVGPKTPEILQPRLVT